MAAEQVLNEQRRTGTAESARLAVLDQHIELRRLLKIGMAQVHAAFKTGGALGGEPLRSLVGVVHDVFVQHLADEEALILPILEDDLPLGPLRARRLREEHNSQRAELRALCGWPEEYDDLELALRFEGLASSLLDDISHEERELLTSEIIRDDCIVIDQSGG
jgi:hypothetical protein